MAVDLNVLSNLINNLGVESSQVTISQDAVDVVLQKYIKLWQSNLAKKNHIATGNLYQSLASADGQYGFKIETIQGITRIYLTLPDYYEYTDVGRQPTQKGGSGLVRQKLQGLKGWISQKGLVGGGGMTIKQKRKLKDGTIKEYTRKLNAVQANKALAFMISRKIHQKGFKGTNWFSSEIDNFKRDVVNAIRVDTGVMVDLIIEKVAQEAKK